MSSFIKESRSVPPASTSASDDELPSSATACSLVVGLAYSNARIVASLLFERRKHTVGRERQMRHSHSDGIRYCVRDCRAGRDDRRLAKPYHSALVVAFACHHVNDKLAYVADACQLVKLHVGIEHPAGLCVHDLFFKQRIADAHDQSAI